MTDESERHDHRGPDHRGINRYTHVAMALHWAIAFFIILNLSIGFFMEDWPVPLRKVAVAIHISSGITVLLLSVFRLAWRLFHRPPPSLPGLHGWEKLLSGAVHWAFYAMMFALPLTGWALISANPPMGSAGAVEMQRRADAKLAPGQESSPVRTTGRGRLWFVIPLPAIQPITRIGAEPDGLARQEEVHEAAVEYHALLAWTLLALLTLHIAGALKHQFLDRQPQFARMGVGRAT